MNRRRIRPFPAKKLLIIPFVIYFIFIIINIFISKKSIDILTKTISKKGARIKLFFGIITTENSTDRRKAMYKYWIEKAVELGHDYAYCTKNKIEPIYKWVPLKEWTDNIAKKQSLNSSQLQDRDRENKRITLAEYFLTKTDADFYLCPGDDVIVDIPRIDNFISFLKHEYNTFADLSMLGSCQTTRNNISFLQGGTGYIMTRRMASEFIKHAYRWVRESSGPDDVEITRFLNYVGKKPSDGAIPYMCGHGLFDLRLKKTRIDRFKKCPKVYDNSCKQGVFKLEDIYIFHPRTRIELGFRIWENFQKLIHDEKHHFGYYNRFPTTHICILD